MNIARDPPLIYVIAVLVRMSRRVTNVGDDEVYLENRRWKVNSIGKIIEELARKVVKDVTEEERYATNICYRGYFLSLHLTRTSQT